MKKILLFVLPFLAMVAVSCEKDGKELSGNDIIEFKDPNFLKALLSVHEIYLYDAETDEEIPYMMDVDLNKDGKISVNEAQKVKGLNLYDYEAAEQLNIKEMPEIKYFTALTHLVYAYDEETPAQLTSLDLSKNMALEYLVCDGTQLTSLNLSKNTVLTYLSCNYSQLTSLDLSNNTALTCLACDDNQLISLDLSKHAALRELSCAGNQLTSLDLSNNTALTYLYCEDNQLTSLDLNKHTALTHLACANNQLISLDLSKNAALTWLHCEGNQLTKIILPANHFLLGHIIQDIINEYGNIIEYR